MVGLALLVVLMGWLYLSFRIWTIDKDWVFGKQVVAFICLWIPYTLAGGNMALAAAGVCISQMRKLTDDELIEAAVRSHIKVIKLPSDVEGKGPRESDIKDAEFEVQSFLEANPNCCAVFRHRDLWDFINSYGDADVLLNYERNASPENIKSFGRYDTSTAVVNRCGKYIDSHFNGSTPTLETTSYTHHIRK